MKIGFNKRLQALFAASGMSQEDAARHLGVSSSTVSRWVRGVRIPSAYQLRNLVHLFGLPYTWFLEDVPTVQDIVWGDKMDSLDRMDYLENSAAVEDLDRDEDCDAADIAGKLGLQKDTVEALEDLAETSGPDVLDAVDEAVYNVVAAANAAYDAVIRDVEQSIRKMEEAKQ